jgi:hypothetical protein
MYILRTVGGLQFVYFLEFQKEADDFIDTGQKRSLLFVVYLKTCLLLSANDFADFFHTLYINEKKQTHFQIYYEE